MICDMWAVGVECVLVQLLLVCFIAYFEEAILLAKNEAQNCLSVKLNIAGLE